MDSGEPYLSGPTAPLVLLVVVAHCRRSPWAGVLRGLHGGGGVLSASGGSGVVSGTG